jgi:hypothetical protein
MPVKSKSKRTLSTAKNSQPFSGGGKRQKQGRLVLYFASLFKSATLTFVVSA